ncbi:MAG: hypothetical protein Q8O53_02745 [Candidatus Moranbacteria bacterium]|nr:hypothetical protein [Candidatus Moranbacteria bacterium]
MKTQRKNQKKEAEQEKSEVQKKKQGGDKAGRKIPYGLIAKIILGSLAVVGVLGVGMAAPGVFQAVKIFRGYERLIASRYQTPSYIRRTLKSLERRGMVQISVRAGEVRVYLTEKGQQELLGYQLRKKRIKGGRWDEKWRIVIFDIEEKRRYARDRIRTSMKAFGFEKLQESVWVYPYECEAVITLLKTQYKAGKELVYIVAGDIENDAWLRKKFTLGKQE